MYNSYISGTLKLLLNGDSTVIHRAGIQLSLAFGSPQNGYYFDDGLHTLGRVHFMISADNTPQLQINQIGQNLDASVFGGLSPYTFYWSTGETTQTITPQTNGNYWLLVTDANGCVSDTSYFNVTFISTNLYAYPKSIDKKLNRILNVLGKPTKPKNNTTLFYIYDDGTVEKRIVIE